MPICTTSLRVPMACTGMALNTMIRALDGASFTPFGARPKPNQAQFHLEGIAAWLDVFCELPRPQLSRSHCNWTATARARRKRKVSDPEQLGTDLYRRKEMKSHHDHRRLSRLGSLVRNRYGRPFIAAKRRCGKAAFIKRLQSGLSPQA